MSEEDVDRAFVAAKHEGYREGYRRAVEMLTSGDNGDLVERLKSMKRIIPNIYGPLVDETCVVLATSTPPPASHKSDTAGG